jgi:hypothetical protein
MGRLTQQLHILSNNVYWRNLAEQARRIVSLAAPPGILEVLDHPGWQGIRLDSLLEKLRVAHDPDLRVPSDSGYALRGFGSL